LQEERDKLLAEKAAWIKPSGNTAPLSEAPSSWEAEKAELIKARDEALDNLKVCHEIVAPCFITSQWCSP